MCVSKNKALLIFGFVWQVNKRKEGFPDLYSDVDPLT